MENTQTLMSLNIWGGSLKSELLTFFNACKNIDIFCLQEVYQSAPEKISTCDMPLSLDIFHDMLSCLPDHQGFFCPVVPHYGLAIFVKKELVVDAVENIMIHENDNYVGRGPTHQRLMQCLSLVNHDKKITICNVHGLWNGKGKVDSPERIIQSKNIKSYVDALQNPYIICGDFNLEPHTESLQIIKEGLVDHIDNNDITSTRTSYYKKPIKFADYVFTSPSIEVQSFAVLNDEVSDHTPLLLCFNGIDV